MMIENKQEKIKKLTINPVLSIEEEYPISYNFDFTENIRFLKKLISNKNLDLMEKVPK